MMNFINKMDYTKLKKVCDSIAKDIENDIHEWEGKVFNGRNISVQFGNQAAAIVALANIVKSLLEEME